MKWKDLTIYKGETESDILRETKLGYTTLHSNNFKKQEVHLIVNICNERTVAKLERRKGMEGTNKFIKLVTHTWNIINIRFPEAAEPTNDSDCKMFSNLEDPHLSFLLQLATIFKKMVEQ